MKALEGKTAIITGGNIGIGFGIAKLFHKEGANVMICGRREELLKNAASQISSSGEQVFYIVTDLTVESHIKNLVAATVKQFTGIDIVVNCAGIMRYGKLDEIAQDDWDLQMKVNTYGPWQLMKEAAPYMRKAGGGSIINISSIAGNKAFPNLGVYCTSKVALQMLSQVMAMELAPDKIRVNMICPGMVEDTELVNPMIKPEDILGFYEMVRPMHPLGRNGKPQDVAEAALFYASDASEWITGTILPVDGGRHMATNRPVIKES